MNVAKSSLKIFGARVCKAVCSFSAVVVFSREVGAAPLGTYYPFLALLGIVGLPAGLGLAHATQKRISEDDDSAAYLGTAIVLKLLPLLGVAAVSLAAGDYVNRFLGADLVTLFVATLLVSSVGDFALGVLRGELRVGETAILEVIRPLSWLVVGYLLYRQGYGVRALVYGYFVGSVLVATIGWWKVSTPVGRPTVEHARSLFEYARFSVISSIGGYFYSWTDVGVLTLFVVLGAGVTRADVGAYENAWRLSLVVTLFGKSIATTLFPQISRWDAEDATEKIESAIPTALLPSLLVVVPAFVGSIVLAKDLLGVLFGPEFVVAWLALIVLAGGKIPESVHILLTQALNAIDRPDLAAYASITSAGLNLLLNVVLIWQFGLVGAAVATTVSFALNTAIHAHYLTQFLELRLPFREAAWSVVASAVMGGAVYGVRTLIELETVVQLFAIILFGAAVYATLVLAYGPVRMEARRTLGPLLSEYSL
ncbi:polysaccharide biosynthesis C-terminal domain-containing protein [Haloplanus litoreus]|uniref:Polysaccharide biosynthesis C-terminal domain-containing protein n=1 Tax=Haloplanus litoreus TaxID=767515 RepID=A0ABD5ZWF7_9EURY